MPPAPPTSVMLLHTKIHPRPLILLKSSLLRRQLGTRYFIATILGCAKDWDQNGSRKCTRHAHLRHLIDLVT